MQSAYQFVIEVLRHDGGAIAQFPVEGDWDPAFECVRFDAVRKGELPPVLSADHGSVQPVWSRTLGQPFVEALQVTVDGLAGQQSVRRIPTGYFRARAEQLATDLVKQSKLAAGERFRYQVLAYPAESSPRWEPTAAPAFTVAEMTEPLTLRDGSLAELQAASTLQGDPEDGDMPVFIPQAVLEEAIALTKGAGELETGGILIGHLQRDIRVSEIFVKVTAQIPLRHAHSQLTRLTFTPDTWTAARAAVDLRGAGEIYLGWWHCHCFMKAICKDCAKYKDGTCQLSAAYLSADDCALHRAVFPRAYSLALVISDTPATGLTLGLFGWKDGVLAPRGFRILQSCDDEVGAPTAAETG